MVRVSGHVVDRQVRAAHPQRRQQPGTQEILPGAAGEHLHGVPGDQVAEVAVLERLSQVLAEGQEPQPTDHLGPGPVRVTEPDQVVTRQAGPVRQEVDDGQAVGHHRVVQPKLRQVVAERTLPFEQAVIDKGADRRRGEGLGDGTDGEQRVRGDRNPGVQVALAPPGSQDGLPVLDGGDGAARDLPRGQLLDDEPFDALQGRVLRAGQLVDGS